ncbi:MAG TPA: glycosyltransferase family 4 protein, partial [Candidatus Kryptonia bacterium]|nr:glycosyltransferase family 4 protein [Candidatus Kryptonia bacterium]
NPNAQVVINGGNCSWPDINWVHCVHHAWPCRDDGAPAWFRIKNRAKKALARRAEAIALRQARIVIANSERTRRDLITGINLDPSVVQTVYLGSDSVNIPPTPAQRLAARRWLGCNSERPLVVFVGALGYDLNKGFDTLWAAWRSLCADSRWDANLIVAGGGRATSAWREKIAHTGLQERVTLLGFTERIADVLDAADLLVSPVRYEGYGLNVQEAICRGTPAMVSACAGVAELYPSKMQEMLFPNPENSDDLARRLVAWRGSIEHWKARAREFGSQLRQYSWHDMARKIYEVAAASERVTSKKIVDLAQVVAENSSVSTAN